MIKQIALVTGATAGIGEATALLLAENNYDVIITGRREERLRVLQVKIENRGAKCLSLCFDVRNEKDVKKAIDELTDEWRNIHLLVNNAGLAAGLSSIADGDINNWNRMIDTNIKGLLYVTKYVSQIMIQRKKGHIVNIGSIAGKEVYGDGNVYCATKHAVNALTKGMRIDFLPYNIKVTQICPGAVETEFSIVRFDGNQERANQVYEGFENLVADDIAQSILFAATRPDHVNISDMVVMPTAQANVTTIYRK